MLWRGNEGENRPDEQAGKIKPNTAEQKSDSTTTMSREELLASDPKAREMYERLRDLRKSVDAISGAQNSAKGASAPAQTKAANTARTSSAVDTPEARAKKAAAQARAAEIARAQAAQAAEAAVRRRAQEDAERIRAKEDAAKAKELKQKLQLEAANRRAAQKQFEAEQKRLQALNAEKAAQQIANQQNQEAIEAAKRARKQAFEERQRAELARRAQEQAQAKAAEEARIAEAKAKEELHNETMDALKEELLYAKHRQEVIVDKISDITDKSASSLNKAQQDQIQELTEVQQQAKYVRNLQRKELQIALERSRTERVRQDQLRKAEKRAAEIKAQREMAEKALAIQRAQEEQARLVRQQNEERARRAAEEAKKAAQVAQAKRAKAEEIKHARELAAAQQAAKAEEAKRMKAMAAAKAKAEKQARELAIKQAKAEKHAAELAAKQAKAAEEARIKQERKDKARALWKEREEKRQAERKRKQEQKLRAQAEKIRIQAEKDRRKLERKRELDEIARLEMIRQEDAAKGGGLVNVYDMTIKTEINKKASIRFRDLLGLKSKEEKNAKTEEERQLARLDREIRTEEARAALSFNRMLRLNSFRNSAIGKKMHAFGAYCDAHKKNIITASAAIATVLVILASGFNYCTAYEYSYNGTPLGIVKNKDDVLRITDLVQNALKEDTNMDVVIDAKDDISFKRVSALGDVEIDTSDDVLKRLTYMSDFKVSSYGIYVDGKKIGALRSSTDVQSVLEDLKSFYIDKYTVRDGRNMKVKQAVVLEKVEVKETNTKLNNIYSRDEMLSLLTTPRKKETVHTTVAGESLDDVAAEFNTTATALLKDNNNINADPDDELSAGTPIVIKQTAPAVTVKLTEEVTYDETIKFETKETKSKEMYKGDKEVTVEGKNGSREVTAEITTVNGKEIGREELISKVKQEPVTEEVTIGTAKRPPTVGDGKFSHPLKDNYRQTTTFRMRWGRFHKGTDMACPTGTPVYAADGGTVIIARRQPSYGNLVVIDHQNGFTTKYAHNSKIVVKEGDKVYEGQKIAEVGSTGNSTGPHCHFEVRYNDVPQDPFDYIPFNPPNRTN
ncbi:MAG: peptidoglycan DD-metalloendopeptidase family protein [Eubacterium sp.]|nr:peptidoglycan DD-metalloendopeptidase family protein [Candidatus Colimonas fimequi]